MADRPSSSTASSAIDCQDPLDKVTSQLRGPHIRPGELREQVLSTLARTRIDAVLLPVGPHGYLALAVRAGVPAMWVADRPVRTGRATAYAADWLGVSLEECPDN